MANVAFEEEQQLQQQPIASMGRKGIVGWLIKHKLAKDERSANTVMLGVIGVCIVLIAASFFFSGNTSGGAPSAAEQFRLEQSTPLPSR